MSDRVDVTVTRLAAFHAFAIDDFGQTYFIYPGNFQSTGKSFDWIEQGTRLRGLAIQHPKGWRLIEIQVLDD